MQFGTLLQSWLQNNNNCRHFHTIFIIATQIQLLLDALMPCCSPLQVEQNWATLQSGEMTIQTSQASEATQAVASLAEAAVAASQEIQPGATVTMALNR